MSAVEKVEVSVPEKLSVEKFPVKKNKRIVPKIEIKSTKSVYSPPQWVLPPGMLEEFDKLARLR